MNSTSDRRSVVANNVVAADNQDRVCDGCFNRLMFEATQPSPDHYRIRHLKMCATDLLNSVSELIDALDDQDGDPNSFNNSLRATIALTKELTSNSNHTPSKSDK